MELAFVNKKEVVFSLFIQDANPESPRIAFAIFVNGPMARISNSPE